MNLEKFHLTNKFINVEPERAYYIPFDDKQKFNKCRNKSNRFILLNGKWNIIAYTSFDECLKDNLKEGSNTIDVPSCVQYYGYDYFQYTNMRYPFYFNPPYLPENNACYHFSRKFNIKLNNKESYYINFEGVDSCLYLFINKTFVGYACISHKLNEFDISKYLLDGENTIDVLVMKWCFESYLEDQDKWRFTGIFRDVYLLRRPKSHITDYKIDTDFNKNTGYIYIKNNGPIFKVIFHNKTYLCKSNETLTLRINNVHLWSAEDPYLYKAVLSLNGEKIFENVGIRKVYIKNRIFYFNNKPIKLLGVNRHDFHPKKGYAVSFKDMEQDVKLMKELNINALRTSHYPSSPLLYDLCDQYGLYVLSESDIETHGATLNPENNSYSEKRFNLVAEDPQFLDSFIRRQIANVQINKNHPCIVIWSIGNESGWGINTIESCKKIKELDSRPIQYESLIYYNREKYGEEEYYTPLLDFASRMYETPSWFLNKYKPDNKEVRPAILCEYAHAMGTGPGGLKDYVDLFRNEPTFVGGFIWEWCDHGVLYKSNKYKYGGDFKEEFHDGNFCIDGIVKPDRSFKAGTLQMKYCYQPLKFSINNKLCIFNYNYFVKESGVLTIKTAQKSNKINICINPQEEIFIDFPQHDFICEFVRNGDKNISSYAQFKIENNKPHNEVKSNINIKVENDFAILKNSKYECYISLKTGEISFFKNNDFELRDLKFNFVRANTDNDRNLMWIWKKYRLYNPNIKVIGFKIESSCLDLKLQIGPNKNILMNLDLSYQMMENGLKITLNHKLFLPEEISYFPNIGFKTKLNKNVKAEYLGYGPQETYKDMYEFALKQVYSIDNKNIYSHQIKPQDCYSHFDIDYLRLDSNGSIIKFLCLDSFGLSPYSMSQLISKGHDYELRKCKYNYLYINFQSSGIGSNACGPIPFDKYLIKKEDTKSIFLLIE